MRFIDHATPQRLVGHFHFSAVAPGYSRSSSRGALIELQHYGDPLTAADVRRGSLTATDRPQPTVGRPSHCGHAVHDQAPGRLHMPHPAWQRACQQRTASTPALFPTLNPNIHQKLMCDSFGGPFRRAQSSRIATPPLEPRHAAVSVARAPGQHDVSFSGAHSPALRANSCRRRPRAGATSTP